MVLVRSMVCAQVLPDCRIPMLTNALMEVSGRVSDIIRITQITLKKVNNALFVDNRGLDFFDDQDLGSGLKT